MAALQVSSSSGFITWLVGYSALLGPVIGEDSQGVRGKGTFTLVKLVPPLLSPSSYPLQVWSCLTTGL